MKTIIKYHLIITISLMLVFPGFSVKAADFSVQEKTSQMIEILKHEITVLQMLIKNIALSRSLAYQITAKSYLVLDINDNKVLLEKNADQAQSIASITKLMNAVVAEENISDNQTINLTSSMLNQEGQSPSLYRGLTISREDLLKASLIQSVNDAAESISYFIGKDRFINLMNQKAKELSMNTTTYVDVNGLNLENKSTARDLSKIVSYVYHNHRNLLNITKNNDFWLKDANGRLLKFQNVNNFYYLPEFLGGKTGYLPEARQSIASAFEVNGKPVAIIILNSSNRQADTLAILNMLEKQ